MGEALDLSSLTASQDAVIHCDTQESALRFVRYMKAYWPEKMRDWDDDETCWSVFSENTVYYPCFGTCDVGMKYGHIENVGRAEVICFQSLVQKEDFPIKDIETDISILLGL